MQKRVRHKVKTNKRKTEMTDTTSQTVTQLMDTTVGHKTTLECERHSSKKTNQGYNIANNEWYFHL